MRICLAKKAGFCMGVKRAVDLVFKTARQRKNRPVFTLGPIIHNPQVLHLLEEQGVKIIEDPEQAPPGSIVVIRAHGVSLEIKNRLTQKKVVVIDATCPRVLKVQQLIKQYYQKGYQPIIVGEREHPEVKGLCSYAQNQAWSVGSEEEIKNLPQAQKVLVVAQTTQNERLFKKIAELIKKRYLEVKVFNTVCNSTHERQEEVRKMAKKVEALVVVGGKMSGNTRRLAQIGSEAGLKTYHIETEDELKPEEIRKFKTIGVTAGASTPYWLIRRVIFRLEDILSRNIPLWWRVPYKLTKLFLLTNFWAAWGGASLAIIGSRLNGLNPNRAALIAFTYLWAMHVLNHLTNLETTRLTDPTRVRFYEKNWILFSILGVICILISLELSKPWPIAFFTMVFLIISGLIYNIEIPILKRKLKDLPASKTIFVPVAWGFVSGIFPSFLKTPVSFSFWSFWIFVYLSALAFIRTCCFDLLDIQGDQMVGRETLPIILGEKNSFKLLYVITIALIVFTVLLAFTGYFPKYSLFYSVILSFFGLYLYQIEKKYIRPGVLSDALIDGQFMLMAAGSFYG